jgi:hypothetical protein
LQYAKITLITLIVLLQYAKITLILTQQEVIKKQNILSYCNIAILQLIIQCLKN